jgi:CDP-diacylglycerol--serine O-phosphatidyltransferase
MKSFKVQVLPTAVSLANFLCGFASITFAIKYSILVATEAPGAAHALYYAAMLICFAMVADLLDGKIARMTGGDSAFGAEIDSLSDVVSFGVAPAVLVVVLAQASPIWAEGALHRIAWIFAGAYAAFAAMRLARYNVDKDTQPGERFSGLPSPAAAGAIISLVLLYLGLKSQDEFLKGLQLAQYADYIVAALPVYTLLLGVLMVTRVRYSHLGRKVLSGQKPFPHLVVLGLIVVVAFVQFEATLAAGFTAYVFAGIIFELVALVSGKSDKVTDDAIAEPASEVPK